MSRLADVERPLMEERDHPVRPWVLAGALLLVVVAVAVLLYRSPLEGGALVCPPEGELVPAAETEAGVEGRDRCVLTAGAQPQRVDLVVTMVNTGRLPIAVEGVELPGPVAELVTVGAMEPFELAGGEERRVELVVEVAACDPTRGERLLTMERLPVRSRFLGVPKTTGALLSTELSVLRSSC